MKCRALATVASMQLFALFALFTLFAPMVAQAEWQPNGVPLAVEDHAQKYVQQVSDGAGGTIVAWMDNRANGTGYDLYAQRVDGFGNPLWSVGGVAVATGVSADAGHAMDSDGAGGAIIAWTDVLSGIPNDLYAQRIDATGALLWTPNGVAVSTALNSQQKASVVADGAGGAFISWQDNRGATGYDIYSQRLNAAGVPQWTADGVELMRGALDQLEPASVPDGFDGVRVAWLDYRSGGSPNFYTRRISGNGLPQGSQAGSAVSSGFGLKAGWGMVTDGDQGAILVWSESSGAGYHLYAARVDVFGNLLWDANGVVICDVAGDQQYPVVVSDGMGGAIIAWVDKPENSSAEDIYAQRVNGSGAVQWVDRGVPLCVSVQNQRGPGVCSDGAGGAIVTWSDSRNAVSAEVYSQRINSVGAVQWGVNGVPLTSDADVQRGNVVADGSGGAIVAFYNGIYDNWDVFVQRVEGRYGEWGRPEPTIDSVSDAPGDQGSQVVVRWYASQRDQILNPLVSHYSIWRSTDLSAKQARQRGVIDSPESLPLDFAGEALWEDSNAVGASFWEWVANQDASYQPSYSILASTRENGTPHSFKVLAHDSPVAPSRIWESSAASGQSVDNLAPGAPLTLTAVRVGSDVQLYWDDAPEPDLRNYMIYRSDSPDVVPGASTLLGSSLESTSVDAGAPPTALYYVVTAADRNDNEGPASNEASVSGVTAVGGSTSVGSTLSLRPNHPNPFTTSTQLQFNLPAPSEVQVDIYDVSGRRVRTLRVPRAEAGWRAISLSGESDDGKPLASGVYFYRVLAGGMSASHKMLIFR